MRPRQHKGEWFEKDVLTAESKGSFDYVLNKNKKRMEWAIQFNENDSKTWYKSINGHELAREKEAYLGE